MSQQSIVAHIGADISSFTRSMERVQAQMSTASNSINRDMRDMDNQADHSSGSISNSFGSMNDNISGSMSKISAILKGGGIFSGLAAAVPMIAAVGASAVALGGSFAAAGVGVAGFAAVATSTLGDVFTASTDLAAVQKEIDNATTVEERNKALEKQKEIYAGLSDGQKEALKGLQEFKSFWGEFAGGFEDGVVNIFTDSLKVLQGVLNGLKPAIQGTMEGISTLLGKVKESLGTPDMQKFFTWLGETAGPSIVSLGTVFGNVFMGIMNVLMAFTPLTKDVEGGLVSMSEQFLNWSKSIADSKGLQNFIDYVRTNAPVIMGIVGDLVQTLIGIGIAMAPVGEVMLSVFGNVVSWVKENFIPLAKGIMDAFMELYAFLEDMGVIDAVKTAFEGLGDVIKFLGEHMTTLMPLIVGVGTAFAVFSILTTVTEAWKALNLVMTMSPFTWIAIAVGALIAAFILLWQNWDTVSKWLSESWNWIKSVAETVWNGLMEFFKEWGVVLLGALAGPIGVLAALIYKYWDEIKAFSIELWNSLKEYLSALWTDICNTASSLWDGFKNYMSNMWNDICNTAMSLWNSFKSYMTNLWNEICNTAIGLWNSFKDYMTNLWNSICSTATNLWNGFKSYLASLWSDICNTAMSAWNGFKAFLAGLWNSISSTATSVWNGIKSFLSSLWSGIQNMGATVFNALKSVISSIWEAIKSVTSNVWNAIKSMLTNFWTGLSTGASNIFNGIKTAVTNVWDGIKSATSNVWNSIKSTTSSVWEGIKTAITSPIEKAKSTVLGIIDKIKDAFSNMKITI
ncbi:phage tail protein, partial [Bacillus mobilis]|uniref:phage tail protein n=1 Tax=Bacillus mobilis TaxID=2026190 RepID=UPI003D64ACC7